MIYFFFCPPVELFRYKTYPMIDSIYYFFQFALPLRFTLRIFIRQPTGKYLLLQLTALFAEYGNQQHSITDPKEKTEIKNGFRLRLQANLKKSQFA